MIKETPKTVTPIQIKVLTAMWAAYGQNVMPADRASYRRLADMTAIATTGGVLDKLRVLRAKGYIESRGGSQVRPEAWVIRGGALSRAKKMVRDTARRTST